MTKFDIAPLRNGSGFACRILAPVLGFIVMFTLALGAAQAETTRVSVASDGTPANGSSWSPSISADGRFVAFASQASNLVDDDTNGTQDIFVHDRDTGLTTRVSVASEGTEANATSGRPSISADGRFVAFASQATNLVDDDTNGTWDVFVHDRDTGETTLVSVAMDGTPGNGLSSGPSISADGRFVAFESRASNLVAGDTNDAVDIFVHDRETGQTTRVSVNSEGTQADRPSYQPFISADGRFVAFESHATNLYPGDASSTHIFLHDRETGVTTRVSVNSEGTEGNGNSWLPSISADGRFVAFHSAANNLVDDDSNNVVDVFVHDRETDETTRVSVASDGTQGNANSNVASISADGRFVAFQSAAGILVDDDFNSALDIFVHDRNTGQTTRVSVDNEGTEADSHSFQPSISADGRFVAFESQAGNLVAGETNNVRGIFVHDRFPNQQGPAVTELVASPNPVAVRTNTQVSALASSDEVIAAAGWTLDGESGDMAAADGEFDESSEVLVATIAAPAAAGLYALCIQATSVSGLQSAAECIDLVVYDPSSGFVTGGGWLWSPPGALLADLDVEGRANFGFVSRFNRTRNLPDGNAQFVFRAGDLSFHSTAYEWLIVNRSGENAQFKGSGQVNGESGYQFMIWAGSGTGPNGGDTFRIKIWADDGGGDVYDNNSNQEIDGGRIMIHR
jgi:Tol biopolymer transport system component